MSDYRIGAEPVYSIWRLVPNVEDGVPVDGDDYGYYELVPAEELLAALEEAA